ncbi:hypothetical protein B0H13DRAFT_1933833 [Mycena leptocephala]|nr:hypothetical protein B0H13DRAFT_1933833 [Mycena leptocephala]
MKAPRPGRGQARTEVEGMAKKFEWMKNGIGGTEDRTEPRNETKIHTHRKHPQPHPRPAPSPVGSSTHSRTGDAVRRGKGRKKDIDKMRGRGGTRKSAHRAKECRGTWKEYLQRNLKQRLDAESDGVDEVDDVRGEGA